MRREPWYERVYWWVRLSWLRWRDRNVNYVSMRDEQGDQFQSWIESPMPPPFSDDIWSDAHMQVASDLKGRRR